MGCDHRERRGAIVTVRRGIREVLCVYKEGTVKIRGGIYIWNSITTMKIVKDVCIMEPTFTSKLNIQICRAHFSACVTFQ